MKYPQLVSDRAVSTISDWLITRLELLGVEAPIVYSRLLLSLLHTPLQVNSLDVAEIPQLKVSGEGRRIILSWISRTISILNAEFYDEITVCLKTWKILPFFYFKQ